MELLKHNRSLLVANDFVLVAYVKFDVLAWRVIFESLGK